MANLENMRETAYELTYLFMDPEGYEDADGGQRLESLEDMKAELHATMIAIDQAIDAMTAMEDAELAEGEVDDDAEDDSGDDEESDEAA
jgi:hypothetical protein